MNQQILKATGIGIICAMGAFFVFGAPTGLIPNPVFARMIPSVPLDYVFLALTSILVGAYAGLYFYGRQATTKSQSVTAYSGVIGGIVAFGCPICNKVFVMALGTTSVMTYIEPYRPIIGAISVAVMGLAVYVKARQVRTGVCPVAQAESQTTAS